MVLLVRWIPAMTMQAAGAQGRLLDVGHNAQT